MSTKPTAIERFISTATIAELEAAIASATERVVELREAAQAELKAKLSEMASDAGFSIDTLFKVKAGQTASKVPAKYRDPENTKNTWGGRGRKPKWFLDAIAGGKTDTEMLINK